MANQETTSYAECYEKMSKNGTLKAPPQRQSFPDTPENVDDVSEDQDILVAANRIAPNNQYMPANPCSPEMYAFGNSDASRIARAWFRHQGWAFTGDQSGNAAVLKFLKEAIRKTSEAKMSTLGKLEAAGNED